MLLSSETCNPNFAVGSLSSLRLSFALLDTRSSPKVHCWIPCCNHLLAPDIRSNRIENIHKIDDIDGHTYTKNKIKVI